MTEETEDWVEIDFEVVKKEFVPDKYKDFIESSIVVNINTKQDGVYKAICFYHPNRQKIIRKVGIDLGFTEVPDKNFSDNTLGMKFSVSDTNPAEYSRVNNHFLNLGKILYTFREIKGSLEQCIEQYQKDYNLVYEKFLVQKNLLENKQISPKERTEVYVLLETALHQYLKIDASKKTMPDYNALGKTLVKIKNKIALVDDKG